jgi:hypothetical protein
MLCRIQGNNTPPHAVHDHKYTVHIMTFTLETNDEGHYTHFENNSTTTQWRVSVQIQFTLKHTHDNVLTHTPKHSKEACLHSVSAREATSFA